MIKKYLKKIDEIFPEDIVNRLWNDVELGIRRSDELEKCDVLNNFFEKEGNSFLNKKLDSLVKKFNQYLCDLNYCTGLYFCPSEQEDKYILDKDRKDFHSKLDKIRDEILDKLKKMVSSYKKFRKAVKNTLKI